MVNKVNKDAFNKLKKLTPKKRMQMANSPVGQSMLSLLTPSQFADLFPKHYRESAYLPDVGGFHLAISKKSQQKQQDILTGLASGQGGSLDQAEKAGRMVREGSTGGGVGGGTGGGGRGNVKGPFSAAQYAATLRQAGFQEKDIAIMTAVGMRESNGNVKAWNPGTDNRPENSHGLFQINLRAHPFDSDEMRYAGVTSIQDLYDPVKNAKVAYYLYYKTDRGIKHWGGYTDGGYRQYMGTAEAAAAGRAVPSGGESTPQVGGTGATPSGGNMVGKAFANAKGNTECATYAQQGGGVGHTSGWTPGQHSSSGGLKPGDWIAAFHGDKYMNIRNRDAPGNGSHVARFESYIYDNNGKVIGMNVTHQYNGSGGVIPGKFMFGSGGEFDAGRYHQIIDRGRPASMSVSDGTDAKVQERQKHFKEHPEADDTDQVSPAEAQKTTTQVSPVQVAPPPMPHPAANAPQTADLAETIKLHKENYLNNVGKNHPAAYSFVGPGKDGVWKQTKEGLDQAGVPYKETKEGLEINISRKDPRYKKAIQDMRDNELDPKAFLDKVKYTPGEDKATASTHAQAMRSKIEGYYGKSISNHEYDMLIRATHAESTARGHSPEEHAMIMGTILNRAKKEGGIEKALMRNKQFESVTGRTRGRFSPNPAYKAGPSTERMGSIYQGVVDHLHRVPSNQEYFASATKKTKFGTQIERNKFGDHTRHADSVFNTKLKDITPDVKTAEAGPPPGTIPLEQTRAQEPGATTPKPAVPEPPKPSMTEKVAKELFPGGGAKAEAKPTTTPTTTPTATPTPTTPTATPAPPTPTTSATPTAPANLPKTDNPVIGASDGGSFTAPDSVSLYPMDKKDNMAWVTPKGEPVATARSGERVDITPAQKVQGNMGPSGPDYGKEMDALRQEMKSSMESASKTPTQTSRMPEPRIDNKNFIDNLNKINKDREWLNPAMARAVNRTRLQETGDPLNNHFSGGNSNYS